MKSSIAVSTLCASFTVTGCQAFAPSAGFASRIATPLDDIRHKHFPTQQTSTSIYATIEDEQKEQNDSYVVSDNVDSISEVFNKDDASEALTFFSPIPYTELTIGIVKETFKGENRVSQTPDSVRGLVKAGFTVVVESGGKKHLNRI